MAIEATEPSTALIQNDIVLFGLIAATLGLIFWLSSGPTPFWRKFFTWVPALLLCYFIPGIYNSIGLIDGNASRLYNPIASRVLLPAALVLLTLTIDLKGVLRLGPKLLAMYAAASVSMAALAGSWIGGGANMLAMKEIFAVDETTFGQFVVVDVGVGYVWMAVLIFLANRAAAIDAHTGADTRAIEELQERLASYQKEHERVASLTDLMVIMGIAFGAVGLCHAIAGPASAWFAQNVSWARQVSLHEPFVWVVVLSTFIGLGLSLTRARRLDGAGASKIGSLFLYILIACIGMQMDIGSLADKPWLLALGVIWIAVHIVLLALLGKLLRVPFFYFAMGSQSNIGGPASAPVVASVFHPSLAPVGALLGALGYATGTVAAYIVGVVLRSMAGQG